MNPKCVCAKALLVGLMNLTAVTFVGATFVACGGSKSPMPAPAQKAAEPPPTQKAAEPPPTASDDAVGSEAPLPPSELSTNLPAHVHADLLQPFTGDLDEMAKRRAIRIGVTYNRTFYFVDRGIQHGVSYVYGRLMEDRLNTKPKTGHMKVSVFFVPLPREALLPALIDGRVDLVAAQVTVTPERQKVVDFTTPTRTNINEIVVTGPGAPAIASLDDLAGKRVFLRKSSSYYNELLKLNDTFKAQGKAPADIQEAPENLEDEDLLEMVNAGLIPAIVVDDYLAKFWRKVYPNLTVRDNVALGTGGRLAVAIRKNSPQLAAALNKFLRSTGLGTAFGDQVERRYLASTKYVKSAASEADRRKFRAVVDLFRKYSDRYDLDYLLMAAQGYQESALNQEARSPVGAIGVMQVMPATGADMRVGDIRLVDPNIHAGVKYMRVTMNAFFNNEPMDRLNKELFTFASYNAGPGRIRQLRKEAEKRGLDPNVWFGNVEQMASERIGRETVTYVANIYKYFVAYKLVNAEEERRKAAKAKLRVKPH